MDEIIKDMAEDDVQLVKETTQDDVTDLAKIGSESPVIRFVNYLIFDAIKQGASDIHIEPKEKQLKIRYRIDGILFEAMNPPHAMQAAIMSPPEDHGEPGHLPSAACRRTAASGRWSTAARSTCDSARSRRRTGRSASCVFWTTARSGRRWTTWASAKTSLTIWKSQIDQPHGIILVTGPTGSGKTTTLYSSLRCMDGNKLNISTVEDPIEYHLAAANQVQVHDKIGMTFAAALRSLLRQDPDVVMLGEIRDAETAHIAVQAALTGHLVLAPCTRTTRRRRSRG